MRNNTKKYLGKRLDKETDQLHSIPLPISWFFLCITLILFWCTIILVWLFDISFTWFLFNSERYHWVNTRQTQQKEHGNVNTKKTQQKSYGNVNTRKSQQKDHENPDNPRIPHKKTMEMSFNQSFSLWEVKIKNTENKKLWKSKILKKNVINYDS